MLFKKRAKPKISTAGTFLSKAESEGPAFVTEPTSGRKPVPYHLLCSYLYSRLYELLEKSFLMIKKEMGGGDVWEAKAGPLT